MFKYCIGLILVLLLALWGCKKNKLSPNCWGEMENALFINHKSCLPDLIIESTGTALAVDDPTKLPKEFRNSPVEDTIQVKVKYEQVEGLVNYIGLCWYRQYNAKIKCIQTR